MKAHSAPLYRLSPSAFGRTFDLSCDRQRKLSLLNLEATPEPWRSLKEAARAEMSEDITTREILASGHAWEREALSRPLVAAHLVAPPGEEPLTERRWGGSSEEAITKSLEVLRAARPGELLYQLHLSPPDELYETLSLSSADVTLRPNLPDLVQVMSHAQLEQERYRRLSFKEWLAQPLEHSPLNPQERVFRVIDLKRSAKVKPSHRAQVLYYALELEALLKREGIEGSVDLEWGGVWLGGAEAPEPINLEVTKPYVMKAFQELTPLLHAPLEEVSWGIKGQCEGCDFWAECARQARDEDHLSRLSGLSERALRALEGEGVTKVSELPTFLSDPQRAEALRGVASVARLGEALELRARAHLEGAPLPLERLSAVLPQGEDVAVFLTAHSEPLTRRVWGLGLLVKSPYAARLGLPEEAACYVAAQREELEQVGAAWLVALERTLLSVVKANRQGANLTLQLYCYSELERRTLGEALRGLIALEAAERAQGASLTRLKALQDLGERAEAVLHVLQGTELIAEARHPSEVKETPVVPLISALVGRYALPIDVIYTLPEVSEALELTSRYPRNEALHYPYGHQLKASMVLDLWSKGEELSPQELQGARDRLTQDLTTRLSVYADLLRRLRDPHPQKQVITLKPFKPPHMERFSYPDLSRLAYLARQERALGQRGVRQPRLDGAKAAFQNNALTRVRALGGGAFELLALPLEGGLELDGFSDQIAVPATNEGLRLAALSQDDQNRPAPNAPIAFVKASELLRSAPNRPSTSRLCVGDVVKLTVQRAPFVEVPAGEELFLCERFKDFNTNKIISALKAHSEDYDQRGSLFVQLLQDPSALQNTLHYPQTLQGHLANHPLRATLTQSQSSAWGELMSQRVSVVWGPPGTGKTHFLAHYINGYLESMRSVGRSVCVVVSAMTNLSIDNLLEKVADLAEQRARTLKLSPPSVIRASRAKGRPHPLITYCPNNQELSRLMDQSIGTENVVVGATQWKAHNLRRGSVDLLVIDEASQMLVQEASIGLAKLADQGRVVMAGDHKQLGPVLVGNWGEDELERRLAGSIFDLTRGADRPGLPLSQLLENFRMCEPLTTLSQMIYGEGYQCATSEVASQRFTLNTDRLTPPESTLKRLQGLLQLPQLSLFDDPERLEQCLARAWDARPLTLIITEGLEASRENHHESALVSVLVEAMRSARSELSPQEDERFWREELFVIGPHNLQNDLTRQTLTQSRAWGAKPFVQTVDKAQGQEARCVIISYGVSDLEFILSEMEFIYDLNRLNVSITRAKEKVILLLSRTLLDGDLSVLDNPKALAGLSYMRHVEARCRARGEGERFELSEGVSLELLSL